MLPKRGLRFVDLLFTNAIDAGKNALDGVVHVENVLMTNLPRLATLENRMNVVCKHAQSLEARLTRETRKDDGVISSMASLADPNNSLTAHEAQDAPIWTEQTLAPVQDDPGPDQPAPPRLLAPAPPDDQAAAEGLRPSTTSIAKLNLLEKAARSQY